MQLLPCGDGIAAAAADPAFGLIAVDGAKRVWREGVIADMRGKLHDAFTLAADGKRVRFGLGYAAKQPLLFDLATFRLTDAPEEVAGLASPGTSGLAITDWEDKFAPKLNGKPIALKVPNIAPRLVIPPEASRFVLRTEWWPPGRALMAANFGKSLSLASSGE